MSTTVTYKGSTLTTVDNQTRTLLTSGKYLEGNITLTDVSGSGGAPKMGVIRPDAEFVQKWTYDKMLVEDEGITLPSTYSTTAATLKASADIATYNNGTPATYRYFITERFLTIPVYDIGTPRASGREEYIYTSYNYEFVWKPAGQIRSLDGLSAYASNVSNTSINGYSHRYLYWNSENSLALISSVNGLYQGNVGPTVNSNGNVITIKSPTVTLRGSSTYFKKTFYEALTDARIQYVIELWRAPIDDLVGWEVGSQFESIDENIANGGKLT